MFKFLKRYFEPTAKNSPEPCLKWPSPMAQMVLDDLDKCPAWEWYNCAKYSERLGIIYRYRQHPYLNYRLDDWFSIEGVKLSGKDIDFIRGKFYSQLDKHRKNLELVSAKENLVKLGFNYEEVKPWLTHYH